MSIISKPCLGIGNTTHSSINTSSTGTSVNIVGAMLLSPLVSPPNTTFPFDLFKISSNRAWCVGFTILLSGISPVSGCPLSPSGKNSPCAFYSPSTNLATFSLGTTA